MGGVVSSVAILLGIRLRPYISSPKNYHRGVVFCGGCGILCGCVILRRIRYNVPQRASFGLRFHSFFVGAVWIEVGHFFSGVSSINLGGA